MSPSDTPPIAGPQSIALPRAPGPGRDGLRIMFFWTDISGYMAACWSELARRPGVELRVATYDRQTATAFDASLMGGVDWLPLDERRRFDAAYLAREVAAFDADVVVLAGWLNRAYRRLPVLAAAPGRRFVMGMDTPWRGTLRQHVARWPLRGYLRRIDMVFVTGERCWQYARRLGFGERRIRRGVYGVDTVSLGRVDDARRAAGPWPRRFLYCGQYVGRKGFDLLLAAHAEYRRRVADPWPLACCGKGELAGAIRGAEGITDLGFLQPAQVREAMAQSGALVLPSLYDPWPLVVVESSAAGLPVVASGACGSTVELVRDGFSGFTFATGDRDALVEALERVHHCPSLPDIGRRARAFAEPYGTVQWADRWIAALS